MPELTYDLIKPLVAQQDVSGHGVSVVFRCPISGREVRSSGQFVEAAGGKAKSALKRSLWTNLRWSLSRMVRGVMGYGVAGQVASTVADTAMMGADSASRQPKPSEIAQATLDAFKTVQDQFAWDDSSERFVAASVFRELQTEAAVLIETTSFSKQWDKNILARMLAEIAAVDGEIAEQEREMFYTFTAGEGPSLDELLAKPALTPAELAETSEEVRETALLLTMAVAMSDEDFAKSEQEKLVRFAGGMGLGPEDLARAEGRAKDFVLDKALELAYADGKIDAQERARVDTLAQRLQIPVDRVQRLDARCRKRKGLL
ncbi:MAG: hypothetical protein CSA66_07385 [Proteobacteria bacterium]|nr:MAG: hypothetical protein CSA66_07385 [Pseudomonadota bacterium]